MPLSLLHTQMVKMVVFLGIQAKMWDFACHQLAGGGGTRQEEFVRQFWWHFAEMKHPETLAIGTQLGPKSIGNMDMIMGTLTGEFLPGTHRYLNEGNISVCAPSR